MPTKFNIDKRKAHYSNLICAGQLTRDEALALLSEPTYDPKLQLEDREYVAKKLGFSTEEFEKVLALPNRRHEEFATDASQRGRYRKLMTTVRPITRTIKKFRGRR